MITPRFNIVQSDEALTVTIYAPFTNVAETEIFMEERDFRFFSRPYFLRLHLPGEVEETDAAAAKYDADTRSFVVTVPKKNKGERFDGLDMLTDLLLPKTTATLGRGDVGIETVGGYGAPGEEDEEEVDWYFEQQMPEQEPQQGASGTVDGYGFAFGEKGVFNRLHDECSEILDIKNPDELSRKERKEARLEMELACFDPDHYLCDLYESDDVKRLTERQSRWRKILDGEVNADDLEFSDKDRERLVSLPKREYLVEKADKGAVFFGLVDIIFGICYDDRVNEGEPCAESAWNMAKLSATLSCCDRLDSLRECVLASMRRSLCFPLYRYFDLSLAVFRDVACVLRVGRVAVVKLLLEAMSCMTEDGRHVFNQLYLEPYAVWVQSVSEQKLKSLAEAVEDIVGKIEKDHLDLELVELEHAAKLTLQEEEEEEAMARRLQGISLDQNRVAANDSDDDSSDSSSSSSDTSSSSSDQSSDESEEGEKVLQPDSEKKSSP